MSGRRAIVGLCMLCALVFSAVAAQGAQAITGTTAFTCTNTPPGLLWGEHCLGSNPGHGESQSFGHVAIAENEKTHATLTNANTANGTTEATKGILATVVAGLPVKITATTVHSTPGAWLENKKTAGGEHYSEGEGKILFSGVTVSEPEHCKVESALGVGEVETEQLTATTKEQGMNLKFEPVNEGKVFAKFKILNNGGTCAALNENVTIVGSVKGQPDEPGATTTFTHSTITTEGTLHFGGIHGPAAGLEGKITIKAGKEPETEPTHPISATTVTT